MSALARDPNGLFVGGSLSMAGGQKRANLALVDAAGGSALAWNPGTSGPVAALSLSGGGVLYAGGDFTSAGGQARDGMAAGRKSPLEQRVVGGS